MKNNKLNDYIELVYKNNPIWFTEEVKKANNSTRIAKTYDNINYLHGTHTVLNRKDIKYKEQEYKVKKLILSNAKTICNFHSTYLLGNPISLTGSVKLCKEIQNIYNYGEYNNIDFNIADRLVKHGNCYEYIYKDNDNITSKIINNEYSYPIYNDFGEYIGFIEYWCNLEHISYYNIYTNDNVTCWCNEGGTLHITNVYNNISGLPIHYKTNNDYDYREGQGLLTDIIPILDEIEDLLSKMGDSIYTLSLNPLLLTTGQAIEGGMDKDGVGYNVALEVGSDMKYVNSTMDYNNIKYYLDTIQNNLNMCAYVPSILGGNGNIANVSEVSLKMLYSLADVYAKLNEMAIRSGFNKRFNIIRKLIGIESKEEYINVTFNYARPQNASELLDNLKKQYDMNAITIESIIELSPLTNDKIMELERMKQPTISTTNDNHQPTKDIDK